MGSPELVIRTASPEDAPAFAGIYEPYVENTAISFEATPPDAREMRSRISRAALEHLPWLTAQCEDEIVGYAYASRHRDRAAYRWCVDTSIYVRETYHRRGAGRRLYEVLLSILGRQGFYRAYAGVSLPNEASLALHRAFGFEPIGVYRREGWKFGRWHDVMWLGRDLVSTSDEANPREPIPFVSSMLQQVT